MRLVFSFIQTPNHRFQTVKNPPSTRWFASSFRFHMSSFTAHLNSFFRLSFHTPHDICPLSLSVPFFHSRQLSPTPPPKPKPMNQPRRLPSFLIHFFVSFPANLPSIKRLPLGPATIILLPLKTCSSFELFTGHWQSPCRTTTPP